MVQNLLGFTLIFLTSLAQAAPNICPQASLIVNALSKASISVTPFCSSFLSISTKTATTTVTSTPAVFTVFATNTVANVITNTVTSTAAVATYVISATVTTSTTVSVNVAKKRSLPTPAGIIIPSPQDPNKIEARTAPRVTVPAAKVPSCLAPFASSIISAGCACLKIPTATKTVTASTALFQVTATQTLTITVTSAITTTAISAVTATTTSVAVQYVNFCSSTNNYGLSYNGGYAEASPGQTGVGFSENTPSTDGTAGGCCNACYNTPSCYIFYLDPGNNNACILRLVTADSATDTSPQCPSGKLNQLLGSYTPGTGFFGLGTCATLISLGN
ncbi:MAG: hypothetical protein Q9168_002729 [Polycauliona sp. 1 TL-2023]